MMQVKETLFDLLGESLGENAAHVFEEILAIHSKLGGIEHDQSWKTIAYDAAQIFVESFGAIGATGLFKELSSGKLRRFFSYRFIGSIPEEAKLYEEEVALKVIGEGAPVISDCVPEHTGTMVLGLPITIRSNRDIEDDIRGGLLIFFDHCPDFKPLIVKVAEMMAGRVGEVLARRRILNMHRVAQKKEWIVEKVFSKISIERGVKMKDIFSLMVEELADIIKVQSCSLFSISEDGEEAMLEAGWPEVGGYHSIGKVFKLGEHPYLGAAVNRDGLTGDFANERYHENYLLIKNPLESSLSTQAMKSFTEQHGIHSILYIPISSEQRVSYLMVFDALEKKRTFSTGDIEVLTFFGKELTQALEIEKLDDILHDFKNPAIAVAGFGRRVKKMVESGESAEELTPYLDIIIKEGVRLQEMAMSLYPVARLEPVDLCEVVRDRYRINREAVGEQGLADIRLIAEGLDCGGVKILAPKIAVERVLDNLFNNATKAIGASGGELKTSITSDGGFAVVKISNTGKLPEYILKRLSTAEVTTGRGLGIVKRLVTNMGGEIVAEQREDKCVFTLRLPRYIGRDNKG
ncbi:MAG: hypothetical protein C0609_03875 [Deltaproteobacteria bacterium]|nr:MAG: hypothetical protein C0609_03875 [Deltaproteobacteria bacterium]